jgi:hypothetical protein
LNSQCPDLTLERSALYLVGVQLRSSQTKCKTGNGNRPQELYLIFVANSLAAGTLLFKP